MKLTLIARGCSRRALSLALLAALVAATRAAEEPGLIPVGASWRFLAASGEPSVPLTAWREVDFDDADWAGGTSGFSLAGDEATVLSASGSAAVRWLVLRVDYADGFAAYLNPNSEVVPAVRRSAGFQPAVSPAFSRQTAMARGTSEKVRRFRRLKTCATAG